MLNRKTNALQRQQSHAERLFGNDAALPEPLPAAEPVVESVVETADESDVVRRSYCILRGRMEMLLSLELRNRRGQTRLIPWQYFGGAGLDHPGELVLLFDGPDGSCQVTLTGRGLDRELLEGVKAQKVSWICELDEVAAAGVARSDPAEPVVTGISIKGGGREWSRASGPSR